VVLRPDDPVVGVLVEIALFTVLFTDGMQAGLRDIVSAWHLPGRALLLGLPLTLLAVAAGAHWVVGLPWLQALLVGAALSATDPVLAAALVGHEDVPQRLRHLLNVERGLNDGIALPIVLVLIAVLGRRDSHLGGDCSAKPRSAWPSASRCRGSWSGSSARACSAPPPDTRRCSCSPSGCSCSRAARGHTPTCSWLPSPGARRWPRCRRRCARRSTSSGKRSASC
jgi:Sodium/hydrogen exchanger family